MALFGNDKKKKKAADKEPQAQAAPKRLIPEDSLPELRKFFDGMQEPVELVVFTDSRQNTPYNAFMESLCRELAEIADKITTRFLGFDSPEAKLYEVDFSPTLLLAPDRCQIRYLGAPLGEEARTLVETIMRLSAGKSGLSQISRQLLQELEEKRHVQVFVNPSCPYCPGQVGNAFRAAVERPDLVSAWCVDSSQHPKLADRYHVGSVPHTVINETFSTLGLLPEERFVVELVTLRPAEELLAQQRAAAGVQTPGGYPVNEVDVVIAGAGPAGLTAAVYAVRSGLTAVVLEKNVIGGQVTVTPVVENYPGFASVPGKRLMEMIAEQARSYADIHEGEGIDEVKVGKHVEVYTDKAVYVAKALILATGASWRKLGAPGEDRYFGFGVSYCSTCDGYLYRDKKAVVVGGGNTALTDALHLKNLGVDVTLVHRRTEFRAEKHLQDALTASGIPTVLGANVVEILGDETKVTGVRLLGADGKEQEIAADAVFVAIGLNPNTEIAQELGLTLDANGYIVADRAKRTSIPRIYAAGDVTGGSQQIVNAVGDGSTAALSAFEDIAHPYWKKTRPA
jgi:thioredoxin reductase (NADPH)